MKTMTCREMGGACDLPLHAETFEEMAILSRQHGMEMFKKGDKDHLDVMNKMKETMKNPDDMQKYMTEKKAQFDAVAHNVK